MSVAATIVARIAGAERALALHRAEALARETRGHAAPWWSEPRRCVGMLLRHGDPSLAAVIDDTPSGFWTAAVPELSAHAPETLRALARAWWSELPRAVAGEEVEPTPVPEAPTPVRAPDGEVSAPQGPAPLPRPARALSREDAARRLGRLHARWFAPVEEAPTPSDAPPEDLSTVRAWWEVSADADGRDALWLVCSPTGPLDGALRALRLEGAARPYAIRRENLERLGARAEVSPAQPPRWTSQEPLSETLRTALTPAALSPDIPTVFRDDIDGPTQRCVTLRLSRGARYAVLLPPALAARAPEARPLSGGWALWSVQVPDGPDGAFEGRLSALGLRLGDALVTLDFTMVPPARWSTRSGEVAVPVFAGDPVLRVRATPARGDLTLYLHGPAVTLEHRLASVSAAEVALDGLADGAYIAELTARDPAVAPSRLALIIERDARGAWPRVEPSVCLDGRPLTLDDAVTADLTALAGRLSITAPPAAAVRFTWEGFARWSDTAYADVSGRVPTELLVARTAPLRALGAEARLSVDLGEWGVVSVAHRRTVDDALAHAREALAELAEDAAAWDLGDALLARAWAERAAAALGFAVSAAHRPGLRWFTVGVDDLRFEGGARRVHVAWVLAVIPASTNPALPGEAEAREALDRLAQDLGAQGAVITDGARWWSMRAGRARLQPVDRLSEGIGDDEYLCAFLERYAAWR